MLSLEERLEKLERSVRRWKRCALAMGAAALVGAGAGAMSKAPIPESIQAQRVDVVNGNGTVVASIGQTNEGGILRIFGADGKARLAADSTADGSSLILASGNKTMVYARGGSQGGLVQVMDPQGRPLLIRDRSPSWSEDAERRWRETHTN
jgi:hypothetical protein